MLSGLIHRTISAVILLAALYAAVTVPIGRRTAYGHIIAICTTQPARDAAHDLEDTGLKLGERILGNTARPARPNRGPSGATGPASTNGAPPQLQRRAEN